ncbi:MAG: hypothetical protein CMM50_09140 [Rhodospirillaceae bacterium]|nr:hypothetical protein [Rhodospirillaceae bacterium]
MTAAAEDWRRVVDETKAYYDGPADEIYRDIWGENIHLGYFTAPDESLQPAMERATTKMLAGAELGPEDYVLDVGCGYGALARDIARLHGSKVLATNISERELAHGRELTKAAGLDDLVEFGYADFHELDFPDGHFTRYFSQEAFLHAVDKKRVLSEARRVLADGGLLVFTDILVRHGTSEEDREKIYARVNSTDMWDSADYVSALEGLGFTIVRHEDWSENVAPTYAWVRSQLEARRSEYEERIGKAIVDRTSASLQFWVDSGNAGKIGWNYFVARK